MKVKISCPGTETLNYEKLTGLQGDLKVISDENLNKLKSSIIKNGFTAPVFIWKSARTNYIIDGHQRIKALQSLQGDGYEIPDVPVVYIEAKNKAEAKKKLLYISSQYGEFLSSEFFDFIAELDGLDDIRLTNTEYNIEGINSDDLEKFFEDGEPENMGLKEKRCPHCGGLL